MHRLSQFIFQVCAAVALNSLGGCVSSSGSIAGAVPNSGDPGQSIASSTRHFGALPSPFKITTLYSFKGQSDGSLPNAALTNVNGTLYGTTSRGGSLQCDRSHGGCGTVFSIDPSGKEKVIYSFPGGSNGQQPTAGLTDVNGTLYGTTSHGGGAKCSAGCGTVYSISTAGAEKVLYRFAGDSDGARPSAGLINVNGTLYGTTAGYASDCYKPACGGGTVFSITTAGVETVLHDFGGSGGAGPVAGLTNVNGTLYGTTLVGGANNDGTAFSISTAGVETVLHSFAGGSDGANPAGDLINVNGMLYGTTLSGGGKGGLQCGNGCGTVYRISTTGSEMVLYSFTGDFDGANPYAGLTDVNGTLYGTTDNGGSSECSNLGCGSVYDVSTAGKETVLHSFDGGSYGIGSDGALPYAGLINVNGKMYGTTYNGGGPYNAGTVYSFSPPGA